MPPLSVTEQGRLAFGWAWRPMYESRAPGRLELLGNHVDYNGGPVLAGAIDRTVTAFAWQGGDHPGDTLLVATDLSDDVHSVTTHRPHLRESIDVTMPADFLAGILTALRERDLPVKDGLQILLTGDVPLGFGMSSSAALCVALTNLLADTSLTDAQVVEIARRAEHLTGAPVGAMDQSASVAGGVILFDGASGEITAIEPELDEHVFAIANSGVHHALNQSAYPTRVREGREAMEALNSHAGMDLEHLAKLDAEHWRSIREDNPSWLTPTLRNRIDHVVSEVVRVLQGVEAIGHRDWSRFGQLMSASGRSSAVSYEISHPVVEELVAELNALPGVLGARMMGGGEGGPALALVRESAVPDIEHALSCGLFKRHKLDAASSFEVCAFGPGASLTIRDDS